MLNKAQLGWLIFSNDSDLLASKLKLVNTDYWQNVQ